MRQRIEWLTGSFDHFILPGFWSAFIRNKFARAHKGRTTIMSRRKDWGLVPVRPSSGLRDDGARIKWRSPDDAPTGTDARRHCLSLRSSAAVPGAMRARSAAPFVARKTARLKPVRITPFNAPRGAPPSRPAGSFPAAGPAIPDPGARMVFPLTEHEYSLPHLLFSKSGTCGNLRLRQALRVKKRRIATACAVRKRWAGLRLRRRR